MGLREAPRRNTPRPDGRVSKKIARAWPLSFIREPPEYRQRVFLPCAMGSVWLDRLSLPQTRVEGDECLPKSALLRTLESNQAHS